VLTTVCRPPGHNSDHIKEFADFLLELVLAAEVLMVGDFNIRVDNENALGLALDILNSIGVRKHISGPTHYHTLDLLPSHKC